MAGQRRGKSRWRLSAKQLHCTQEQVQADNGLKQDGLPVNSSCVLCGVACQARAISCILRALLLLRMHAQQHAQLPKGQYPCQHQVAASDATAGSKPNAEHYLQWHTLVKASPNRAAVPLERMHAPQLPITYQVQQHIGASPSYIICMYSFPFACVEGRLFAQWRHSRQACAPFPAHPPAANTFKIEGKRSQSHTCHASADGRFGLPQQASKQARCSTEPGSHAHAPPCWPKVPGGLNRKNTR